MWERIESVQDRILIAIFGIFETICILLSGSSSTSFSDIFRIVAESSTATAIISILSISQSKLQIIASISGLLFFGYIVYATVPRLFPESLSVAYERTDYRVLLTILVLLSAERFTMYLSEDMALSSWTQEATLIVLLTISVIYLYSFVLQFQEDIDSQSIINRMFERMRPNDVNLGSEPGHYVSTFYFGTALVLPFPVLTVGIVGAGQLFPIPEIIAIIWGLGSVVEQYSRIEIKGWFPKQDRLDIEGRIFSIIINIYRSAKGLSTTQIVLLGLVSNIPILTIGLRTFINYLQTFTLGEPMQMWTELGLVTTFFGSFLFSSWFWLREMGRIPHFIKEWEKKHSETPTLSEMDLGPPRTRPVGVLMPFLLVMTISSIYSAMQRLDYYFGHGESLTALFAILWPVLAVSLYYCSKITQAKNSQPVNTESYVLPVALIVNWVGIYAIDAIPYVVSVLWLDFTYRPDHGGAIGVILAVMLFFYWNPDVESRLSKEHSWRKHASAISLILFGIGFMILWYLSAIPDIRFVTLLIGIVAIAGGIAGMFEYKLVFS